MAIESIKRRINNLSAGSDQRELLPLINAMYDALVAVSAKLDADATVTDTDYAATVAAKIIK